MFILISVWLITAPIPMRSGRTQFEDTTAISGIEFEDKSACESARKRIGLRVGLTTFCVPKSSKIEKSFITE